MVDIQSRFQVRSFAKFPRTSPSRGGSWNAIAPPLLRRSFMTIPTVYPTSERYGLSDRHHQPWWWWKTLLVGLVLWIVTIVLPGLTINPNFVSTLILLVSLTST